MSDPILCLLDTISCPLKTRYCAGQQRGVQHQVHDIVYNILLFCHNIVYFGHDIGYDIVPYIDFLGTILGMYSGYDIGYYTRYVTLISYLILGSTFTNVRLLLLRQVLQEVV